MHVFDMVLPKLFVELFLVKKCRVSQTLHPGRQLEDPGRFSGRRTGRKKSVCKTLHPGRQPEDPGRLPGRNTGRENCFLYTFLHFQLLNVTGLA